MHRPHHEELRQGAKGPGGGFLQPERRFHVTLECHWAVALTLAAQLDLVLPVDSQNSL